ncbi:chromosome segregation protein SMC [Fusobacterium sp.]|uniref:chromosome segregation protein SMC n=1 Tax=Fusobacterium sp. TaxID=68766 RepID=UPI0026050948|nr:chromosome segregation protein SMC [Fusobacterium sp.]
MYLKGVEIYGFKSFGERIKIDFDGGITSIVGPNGSGKSNILDAILWVLGEQSYKNIRAKESKDIIFSGGDKKKPANSAEVSLYIDNRDRFFPMNEDVAKVTRKLYLNGENEYYINDRRVRLKDINDMFMDTGVGKSAYSVIGQGKVERIISSSKREVKEIIEEAAGVKKFQQRKLESERKLENVSSEIEKIELILNETGENRTKIKKQAERALAFLELKNERDSLNKGIVLFDLDRNKTNLEKTDGRINESNKKLDEIKKNRETSGEELNKITSERETLKTSIEENINKNEELKNTISNFEKEKVKLLERQEAYKRDSLDRKERLKQAEERATKNKEYHDNILSEKEKISQNIKSGEADFSKYENEIAEKESEKKEIEKDIEVKKRQILDFEVEKLQYVNDIESSSRRVKGSNSKISSLNKEIEETETRIKENKEFLDLALKNKTSSEKMLKDTEERQGVCEKQISEISINTNRVSEILRRDESEEHRDRVKYDSLVRFEENNDGFFRGVKEVLNCGIKGVNGALISLISIPEYLEKAIESAIPGNLQDIVVDDSNTAKKCIEILKERKVGRASFLALDTIKTFVKKEMPSFDGVVGRASELIKFDSRYQKVVDMVLGNLLIVKDIDTAINITKKNLYSGSVVTLTGELIAGSGRITGGETKNSAISQMFERRKEMKRLEKVLAEKTLSISENRNKLEMYSKKLEELENEIYQIDVQEEALKKKIKAYTEEYDSLKQKDEKLCKNRDMFVLEKQEEEQYAKEYEKRIKNSSLGKENIEKVSKEMKEQIDKNTNLLESINETIKNLNEEFSDIKIKFLNSKDRITQIENEITKNISEKNEIENEINLIKSNIVKFEDEIKKSVEELKKVEENKKIKEYEFEKENRGLQVAKEREAFLELKEKELIGVIKDFETEEYREEEKLRGEKERYSQIIEKISSLEEGLRELEKVEAKSVVELNYRESSDKVRNLTNKLKDFETVNLLAVEEFEELDKKYQFIKAQKDDLEESQKSLFQIIDEISKAIEERFFDAYKNINENFNMMCMETIDNSEGNLVLSNEDTYENCGVEIYVKFKNKKRQSLTLLSGGEKSMVAIAFIMAIFMYKPSPFTFLDEIEAALDEKNTKKLINKLKEFTEKSQFILITHNKETMKSSDTLFGVTMNKKIGISKIVPVKL